MEPDAKKENVSRRQLLQSGAAATAALAVAPMLLSEADAKDATPGDLLVSLRREHPRLLAAPGTWEKIKTRRSTVRERPGEDALFADFLRRGEAEARAILAVPPVTYKKDGKRLLHVSRVVLRRVLLLALHFRLTEDPSLLRRAGEEMRAVAAFTDWNPSHFLDVGEMTAALAFGYDWLYDALDAATRATVAAAIVEKGLRPGLGDHSWLRVENNWNAVCLGGLTLGALAVAESEPALAAQILAQTKNNNPNGLKPYAPDGVYPEGAMYWGYGTTFEAVLLDALRTALGTDWGLSRSPGFLAGADALFQQRGPTGTFFNFSDNVERPGTEPAMWWYARTLKRPDLLGYERERLRAYASSTRAPQPESEADRLLPLAALWWPDARTAGAGKSAPLNWYGRGPNPLAAFRSAWDDPRAMYLALKGGSASLSHAHMDAGSFVFEANGVRWARDLGMQDYLSLESKGVDLWNGGQDSQRWGVFRLGPLSHNTLVINAERHRVDGRAVITHFSDTGDLGAIVDLSPIFRGQAGKVTRGFAFRPGSHVLIRDEIEGLKAGAAVRWAMLTRADVSADGPRAVLRENDQEMRVRLHASVDAKFEVISAEPPKNDFDAPNPGARLLIVHLTAPASGRLDWSVVLQTQPELAAEEKLAATPLSRWPQALTD